VVGGRKSHSSCGGAAMMVIRRRIGQLKNVKQHVEERDKYCKGSSRN
jgi:hypothetical protein